MRVGIVGVLADGNDCLFCSVEYWTDPKPGELMRFNRMILLVMALALVAAACGSSEDAGQTTSSPSAPPVTADIEADREDATANQGTTTSTENTSGATSVPANGEQTATTVAAVAGGRTTPVPVPGVYSDVAVVGCSQTRDAMVGYMALTDRGILGDRGEARYLSGGSIERWTTQTDNPFYWDEFANWNGPESDALWIQVCWATNGSRRTTTDDMAYVVATALDIIGRDVPVFISGLNDWDPRDLCTRGDYELSWQLAEAAVAAGFGVIGPDPGVITPDLTDDGCHGNEAGDAFMGEAVLDFFG